MCSLSTYLLNAEHIRLSTARPEGYLAVNRTSSCDLEGEDVNHCVNIWAISSLAAFLRRFVLKAWSNSPYQLHFIQLDSRLALTSEVFFVMCAVFHKRLAFAFCQWIFKTFWHPRVWMGFTDTRKCHHLIQRQKEILVCQDSLAGCRTGMEPALLTPSPVLFTRHTVTFYLAVLAETWSFENFPSPQYAAGNLRCSWE